MSTAISLPTLCGDMDAFQRQIHVHVEIDNDEDRHRWCEATSNAFKQLKSSVSNRRREIHALVFREVARREPAKYLDIQRLKQTDALIREYLDVVQAHLASFAATEVTERDVTEQDEAQMQLDELKLVADQLLASLREQEEAVIETFAESINE